MNYAREKYTLCYERKIIRFSKNKYVCSEILSTLSFSFSSNKTQIRKEVYIIEEWRDIDGIPGYSVSNCGRVYSHKRDIILKPGLDGWGYQFVILYKNGEKHHKRISRLVAETFVPNPYNKPEVNHEDGNKLNNHASNLTWVTISENKLHAFHTGLNMRSSYNAGKPKRKVLDLDTGIIYDSINECAKDLDCTRSNVISCLKHRTESCRGHALKYVD